MKVSVIRWLATYDRKAAMKRASKQCVIEGLRTSNEHIDRGDVRLQDDDG
jgi:hypothetical protein